MKILVLPDAHLHIPLIDRVDQLLDQHTDWYCVSLGDWFDDWGRPLEDYRAFIKRFHTFLTKHCMHTRLCWGNHDYGYWVYPGHHSGYSKDAEQDVRTFLRSLKHLPLSRDLFPEILIKEGDVLFSHAGITRDLFSRYHDNAHGLIDQSFVDWANYTLAPEDFWLDGSPLWHRPSTDLSKNTFNPRYLQVVGHTPVSTIIYTLKDNVLYTDTWSTDSHRQPLGDQSLVVVDTDNLTWEIIK